MLHEYKNKAESIEVTVGRTIQSIGNAAEEILKITNEKNIDTLVIGKKGKYGTTKDMLGGTSYKLLHFCQCTVTVVK
jgi:nucleotide-binding universal stress UspA family protein